MCELDIYNENTDEKRDWYMMREIAFFAEYTNFTYTETKKAKGKLRKICYDEDTPKNTMKRGKMKCRENSLAFCWSL